MSADGPTPGQQYLDVMTRIRARFDTIRELQGAGRGSFSIDESIAFNLRKILEGLAFGCLIAVQNGLKTIPKDAQGQWNADTIFARLAKRDIAVLPNPSDLRSATESEKVADRVQHIVEGRPDLCLTIAEVRAIYQSSHGWLHEKNPYVGDHATFLAANENDLWKSVDKIWHMLERHFVSVAGEAFYCTLNDKSDGQVRVVAASKAAA